MSQQEKPKRTFSSVFSNRVFGAARSSGLPKSINGLIFFKSEANSLDPKDPSKAKHYTKPKLGNAFILDDDKINRIMAILTEGSENTFPPGI